MFRRIELITGNWKHGLMGPCTHEHIVAAWLPDDGTALKGPKNLHKNCRFFFTEAGWDRLGRKVVSECVEHSQRFRIITVKEATVDVVWRDRYEVAVRPRKDRRG